jgi:hypothetical protein
MGLRSDGLRGGVDGRAWRQVAGIEPIDYGLEMAEMGVVFAHEAEVNGSLVWVLSVE